MLDTYWSRRENALLFSAKFNLTRIPSPNCPFPKLSPPQIVLIASTVEVDILVKTQNSLSVSLLESSPSVDNHKLRYHTGTSAVGDYDHAPHHKREAVGRISTLKFLYAFAIGGIDSYLPRIALADYTDIV